MAEKLDQKQVVTFEELLRAMMMEQDATRRILVRKGLMTNSQNVLSLDLVRVGTWMAPFLTHLVWRWLIGSYEL